MGARRTKEQYEQRERSRQKVASASSSSGESFSKKRKPRGALFHGEDPTLAKRAEEELYTFGR